MATKCVGAIKACKIRLVRNDSCGRPVTGPKSVLVTSGFISVEASADIEEGEEFLQKNACGELCISEKDCDVLKRYNLTINLCRVDPDAVELMTAQRLLTNAAGDARGFAIGEAIQCNDGWSLELWQKVASADVNCDADGDPEWLYWAFPQVTGGILGDLTFENGPFTFSVTANTKAVGESNWGTDNRGPFQVLPAGAGLIKGEHVAAFITDVQPPEDSCGASAFPAAAPVVP